MACETFSSNWKTYFSWKVNNSHYASYNEIKASCLTKTNITQGFIYTRNNYYYMWVIIDYITLQYLLEVFDSEAKKYSHTDCLQQFLSD